MSQADETHLRARPLVTLRHVFDRFGLQGPSTKAYAGFNLIYGDVENLRYHNNIEGADVALTPGIHGLSNHFLDTPWPKVVKAKQEMRMLLDLPDAELPEALFHLLADDAGHGPTVGNGARCLIDLYPNTGLRHAL